MYLLLFHVVNIKVNAHVQFEEGICALVYKYPPQ